MNLGVSLREAIQHPSVDDTIGLLQASIDKSQNDFIGNVFSLLKSLLNSNFNGGVGFLLVSNQLFRAHSHKSVSLSNNLALGSTARSRRTKENDSRRLAGSSIAESNS